MRTPPPSANQPEAITSTAGPQPPRSAGTGGITEAPSRGAREATGIDDPAQLIRVGVMLSKLNAELKEVDLDDRTVDRLYALHGALLGALTDNLGLDLASELTELSPTLDPNNRSEAQIRLAHLQLSGWLEGLFQGIQLNVVGQQLQAQLGALETRADGPNPKTSAARAHLSGTGAYL